MATTKFEKPMGTEVETLKNQKINKSDIVNNLTTNDETKPLSAAQGYALNSKINNQLSDLYFATIPSYERDYLDITFQRRYPGQTGCFICAYGIIL